MKLLIVRHAEPDYSIDSLTKKGWREAELLSERLKKLNIKKVYCSPLGRAKDTASLTLEKIGKQAQICDWLEEFNARIDDPYTGEKNRRVWDCMPAFWTKEKNYFDREEWCYTELMKKGDVEKRYNEVVSELDRLIESHGYEREGSLYRAVNPNSETVILFCHFGVECVLLSHLLGISPMALWHGFVALPSSVTTLITEEREQGFAYWRCNGFGDISHLYAADEPPSFAARFCEKFTDGDRH